jgi:hypothetical protein
MTNLKHIGILAALAVAVALASAAPSCAQTTTTTSTTTPSIGLENSHPVVTQAPKSSRKIMKFHGVVFSASTGSIVLRTPNRPLEIHSFSYSPQVHTRMIEIISKGGFQPGDKVTVKYAQGTTVALHLSGRPSKRKAPKKPAATTTTTAVS